MQSRQSVAPSDLVIAGFEVEPWEEALLRQELGDLTFRTSLAPLSADAVDLARDARMLTIFIRSHLTADLLELLPALRFVATRSTGYDHIDLETCHTRGIVVSNVPTYGEDTVAEHTFGLILALSRKIHLAHVRTVWGDFSLQVLLPGVAAEQLQALIRDHVLLRRRRRGCHAAYRVQFRGGARAHSRHDRRQYPRVPGRRADQRGGGLTRNWLLRAPNRPLS